MSFVEMKPFASLNRVRMFLIICCVFGILIGTGSAETTMFHANPEHTGVYSDGGILPTNNLKWSYQTGGNVFSSPAVSDGVVYFGSVDDNIYAVNADTGTLVWKYTTGGDILSSPAVSRGIVYIGSNDKKFYALDTSTGSVLWSSSSGINGWVQSSPTVKDGVVYVGMYGGSMDYRICAFNATTGSLLWSYITGGSVDASPVVVDDIVYLGCGDNKVYAINATTGTLLWTYTTDGRILTSPTVAEGTVFVSTAGVTRFNGKIFALNSSSGNLVWSYDVGDWVLSSPAVSEGIVYFGGYDTDIYALDTDIGELVWRYNTTDFIFYSSPAIANNTLYIGTNDGKLYALNAGTGAHLWHYMTGGRISSSPAVAHGVVFVGSNDGRMYALGGPATPSIGPVHNINTGVDYANITLAVKDAEFGDTIVIDSGIYFEHVFIDKPLTLEGKDTGGGLPIIDGAVDYSSGTPIRIVSDGTIIKSLIVQNGAGASNHAGVIIGSDNNIVQDCIARDNMNGIYVVSSDSFNLPSNNLIVNCTASENYFGISILGYNTTLINNTITDTQGGIGLWIYEMKATLKNNTIFGNYNPEEGYGYNLGIGNLYVSDLDLDIDTSNLVEGKPIFFLKGVHDLIIDSDDNPGAFYCLDSDNMTIRDLNIERNGVNIYLWNTTNVVIKNTSTNKGGIGLHIQQCSNVSVLNVTSLENENRGLESSDSSDIVVENSTIRDIFLQECDRPILRNNTFIDNPDIENSNDYDPGVLISYGVDVIVTGNSVSYNVANGLDLQDCNGIVQDNHIFNNYGSGISSYGWESNGELIISDNLIENNYYGIQLEECDENIIENNSIFNNEFAGLLLITDYPNLIYNNNFQNTQNVEISCEDPQIIWNVDPTPGQNVVGGPSIGGNYWGSPDDLGFSDTAEDLDGDGFADSPYEIYPENIDNYPLVLFSGPPTPEELTANFAIHVMPVSSYLAYTVQCMDQSIDPDDSITAWSWDFGDGGTSSDQNAVHQYGSPGSYPVTLQVTNSSGTSDSIQRAVQITDYIQITDDSVSQRNPAIDGDRIVWDEDDGDLESNRISLYRISEDSTNQISSPESAPYDPAISGDTIVWMDNRNMDMSNSDIYLYSMTAGEESGICTDAGQQSMPVVSGDYVCWGFHDDPIDELYLYQISTQETTQITGTIPWWESPFAIDGDYVVYLDNADGDADLYLYTISTGISTPIRTGLGDHWRPEISGDRVVFEFNEDIFLYNITSKETITICNTPEYQRYPHIDGDYVVWFDGRNSASNAVYSYDLSTQTETVLFNDDSTRLYLDLSDDTIVWSQYDGNDWEVCYLDLSVASSENQPPVSGFDYEFPLELMRTHPTPDDMISFYDDSWDLDNDAITSWTWDFGDGTTSTERDPTHQYAASGTYLVNLTVTDSYGSTGWYEEEIIVNYPPTVSFTMDPEPPIDAGESITFNGMVSDSDGSIQMSTWMVGGNEISEEFPGESPLTYTFNTAGLYAVGLGAIDDVGAEGIVIWPVVVNDPAMITYCMLVPGMTVEDQQLAIFTNITSQYLANDVVTIADDDVIVRMNGLTTTIHTDGLQDVDGNGILTGTVTSGTITSDPLVSDSLSLSPVQASFTANLGPDSFLGDFVSAAIITANLSETASSEIQSAYELAAVNASLDIVDIAYAFNIIGASMLNGIDVLNAEIVMTAPESWVETQGGPEYVRIFRYSEYDGTTETLTPTWSLDSGIYTFMALSPNGLSVFSLVGVQSANSPPVITIPGENEYQFLYTWGDQGTGDGQFNSPRMIDVDAAGNVYVTDSSNNRIQKFDTEGRLVTAWGTAGSGEGQFNGPIGIVVDSEDFVYVADYFNHRIQKFDSNGAYVTSWGTFGDQPGQLNGPYGLALDSEGSLFVSESGNFRIQKFDSVGNSLSTLSGVTSFPANFSVPRGIAFDSDDNLYIVAYHEILKFDSGGNFITRWGGLGDAAGQLNNPVAVAIDSKGTIFVSEPDAHRISVFDAEGTYLSRFGSYGSGDGQFDRPNGIDFDDRDTLYVADELNYRIQSFSPTLRFVIDEGEEIAFTVLGTDQDNDQVTLDATGLPAGASFDAITGQFSWTPLDAGINDGIIFTASDGESTDTKEVIITVKDVVINSPPIFNTIGSQFAEEGQLLQFTISATDQDGDHLSFTAENMPLGATFNDATFSWTPGFDQAGTYQDIQFTVNDGAATDSENITIVVTDITLDDEAPLFNEVIAAPNPVQLNNPIVVTTTIDDTATGSSVISGASCLVDGVSSSMSASDGTFDEPVEDVTFTINGYPTAGVHNISVTAMDAAGNPAVAEEILLAVYDPSAGFVTGGGWIMSPEGAYAPDPTMTGKATFGFVSKYQKGAKVPTGQTEFQFKTGNLNFKSTIYDWLVVAGSKAQYKGVGTINGAGEYGFMLTAIDGAINGGGGTDKFRIKIWDKATDQLVYDNQLNAPDTSDPITVIGGGSIVIHTK